MVVINGSLDNLQSSLDFFLSITSKNLISDSKEMRGRFFEIFKNEDSFREENFLMFQEKVSDDYEITENAEPILVGDEESYSFGSFSFADDGVGEEEYPSDDEVYVKEEGYSDGGSWEDEDEFISYGNSENEETCLEEEKSSVEIEKNSDYSYYSSFENEKNSLDNEKSTLETENIVSDNEITTLENENNDLDNENYELEDDEFIDYSSSEEENTYLENEKVNPFSSIDISDFGSSDEIEEEYEEEVLPLDAFSSVDVGGFSSEDSSTEESSEDEFNWGNYDDEELEEDNSSWGSYEEESDETPSWGNYEDEEVTEEENTNSSVGGVSDKEEVIEEDTNLSTGKVSDEEDSLDSFFDDLGEFDKSFNVEEVKKEEPKNKVAEVKREVVEEAIEVPKDLREFVKLYHNCEMSFALKYFTKKEIDKQLSLGRVFKRKNRLLI